jgi:hypothetical protein
MGLGMGLTMSPMSTAAMNSVDRSKAGVASGVLSMSRMVGGTFGVAVMGALVTTIGRSTIDQQLPHVPATARAAIANALGAGASPSHTSAHIASVARDAFVSALGTGLTIGACVTVCGAIVSWALIQRSPTLEQPEGAAAAGQATLSPDEASAELTLV